MFCRKILPYMWFFGRFILANCISDSTDSWSRLELSPRPFQSLPIGGFRVSIYEHSRNNDLRNDLKKYYYTPLALFQRQSARCNWSKSMAEYEVQFTIIMWTRKDEQTIHQFLKNITGYQLQSHQIHVLPVDRVILRTTRPSDVFRLPNNWMSYSSQPQYLDLALIAPNQEICEMLADEMRNYPKNFRYLELDYALEGQTSQLKSANIRLENVISGSFFAELNQRFPDQEQVFVTTSDEIMLLSEISNEILAENFEDADVVVKRQEDRLWEAIKGFLSITKITTTDFTTSTWNSVLWANGALRPDKVATSLNELYSKSDDATKQKLISSFGNMTTERLKTWNSVDTIWNSTAFSQAGRDTVSWAGNKFIPKVLTLSRINLGSLRQGNIKSRTISVKCTTSILKTSINYDSNVMERATSSFLFRQREVVDDPSVSSSDAQITSALGTTSINTVVRITNNSQSTSPSSGSLIVDGGIGVGGSVFIGGHISVSGHVSGPLYVPDTRNVVMKPIDYPGQTFITEMKNAATVGIDESVAGYGHVSVTTTRPWGDDTVFTTQLLQGKNGLFWRRSTSDTTWSQWIPVSGRLDVPDKRSDRKRPMDYTPQTSVVEMKNCDTIDLTIEVAGWFHLAVTTTRPWFDNTVTVTQTFYSSNGLFWRSSLSDTTWSPWNKIGLTTI